MDEQKRGVGFGDDLHEAPVVAGAGHGAGVADGDVEIRGQQARQWKSRDHHAVARSNGAAAAKPRPMLENPIGLQQGEVVAFVRMAHRCRPDAPDANLAALAPMAVIPALQRQGFGSLPTINRAGSILKTMVCSSVFRRLV